MAIAALKFDTFPFQHGVLSRQHLIPRQISNPGAVRGKVAPPQTRI